VFVLRQINELEAPLPPSPQVQSIYITHILFCFLLAFILVARGWRVGCLAGELACGRAGLRASWLAGELACGQACWRAGIKLFKPNISNLTEEFIDEDNPINHKSDNQVQQCFVLKEYIPPSVLRFLMHPNPVKLAVQNNNV
jgi:hypothetical protein